jgi:8-oxo-dGTP diphosphatase
MVRIEDFNAKASSWADEISWVPIHDIPVLAFDHNLIMATTIELLKQKLHVEPICFDMLPDRFTLSEFQQLYEYAYNQSLDKANFRKKIKHIPLLAHDEKQQMVKHRPAKLFSFSYAEYIKKQGLKDYQFKM